MFVCTDDRRQAKSEAKQLKWNKITISSRWSRRCVGRSADSSVLTFSYPLHLRLDSVLRSLLGCLLTLKALLSLYKDCLTIDFFAVGDSVCAVWETPPLRWLFSSSAPPCVCFPGVSLSLSRTDFLHLRTYSYSLKVSLGFFFGHHCLSLDQVFITGHHDWGLQYSTLSRESSPQWYAASTTTTTTTTARGLPNGLESFLKSPVSAGIEDSLHIHENPSSHLDICTLFARAYVQIDARRGYLRVWLRGFLQDYLSAKTGPLGHIWCIFDRIFLLFFFFFLVWTALS